LIVRQATFQNALIRKFFSASIMTIETDIREKKAFVVFNNTIGDFIRAYSADVRPARGQLAPHTTLMH
jgi:hypothetical protein